MAAMKREKQYDMFDVATGVCDLDSYLNQRYSENDLSSKFWIEKTDEVDELRPPPPGSESTDPVVIPIQGPRAPQPAPESAPKAEETVPQNSLAGEPKVKTEEQIPISNSNTDGMAGDSEGVSLESVRPSAPPETPSLESVALGTLQPQTPGLEHFQRTSSEVPAGIGGPGADQVQLGTQAIQSTSNPISMEDLLAQFHEATKAYEKRLQENESQPPEQPES